MISISLYIITIVFITLAIYINAGVIERPNLKMSSLDRQGYNPARQQRIRSFPLRDIRSHAIDQNAEDDFPRFDPKLNENFEERNDEFFSSESQLEPEVEDPLQFNTRPVCGPKYIWYVDEHGHVYFDAFACEEDLESVDAYNELEFLLCPADVSLNLAAVREDDSYLRGLGCFSIPHTMKPAELLFQNGVVGWSTKFTFDGEHLQHVMNPGRQLTLRWTIVAVVPQISASDIKYLPSSSVRYVAGFKYLDEDLLEYRRTASAKEPRSKQDAMDILRPYSNEQQGIIFKYEKILNTLEREMSSLMDRDSEDTLRELLMKGKAMKRIIESKMILLEEI